MKDEKIYLEIKDNEDCHATYFTNENEPLKKKSLSRDIQYANLGYCVLFYGCIHGYMEQLFPSNYSLFENIFSINPVTIGTAAFLQKLLFTIASPIWGVIIDISDCNEVIKFSTISLVFSALLICFSTNIQFFFFSMCFWGFISAILGPLSQKVASNQIFEGTRGKYFGKLMFFQSIGRQIALLFTGFISTNSFKNNGNNRFGHWMLPFLLSSISSLFLYIYLKTVLPKKDQYAENSQIYKKCFNTSSFSSLNYVFKSKTIASLFILGMVNAIPRSALNFIPMWLELTGLSTFSASIVVSISWVAAMIVSPIVGFISDLFYRISPTKGRVLMAQFSLILRSIFIYYLIIKIPVITSNYTSQNSKLIIFSTVSFAIGLLAGWPGIGACRPILCEIILPQHRATIFALFSTLEGIGAAFFGTRFLGYLAVSLFGYNNLRLENHIENNQLALGKAIICTTAIPWLISTILFYFVKIEVQFKSDNKTKLDRGIDDKNGFLEVKIT